MIHLCVYSFIFFFLSYLCFAAVVVPGKQHLRIEKGNEIDFLYIEFIAYKDLYNNVTYDNLKRSVLKMHMYYAKTNANEKRNFM